MSANPRGSYLRHGALLKRMIGPTAGTGLVMSIVNAFRTDGDFLGSDGSTIDGWMEATFMRGWMIHGAEQ